MRHTASAERGLGIGEMRLLHALNSCRLLPGPEARQLATYIGWWMHRRWGVVAAGAFFYVAFPGHSYRSFLALL
ncbi:chromate transporter [Hydrogenophaga sp.]|uniref:chromate transporter n=1 Tax=Hydrogenophaga sp. TaxID=1904254 RepID=UPI00351D37D2